MDIGCGVGPWLRAALDLGASEVLGMDGDYIDPATLMIDPSAFIPADLAAMSLKEALGDRAAAPFDLVICMEVAEHLPHDPVPTDHRFSFARRRGPVLCGRAIPIRHAARQRAMARVLVYPVPCSWFRLFRLSAVRPVGLYHVDLVGTRRTRCCSHGKAARPQRCFRNKPVPRVAPLLSFILKTCWPICSVCHDAIVGKHQRKNFTTFIAW